MELQKWRSHFQKITAMFNSIVTRARYRKKQTCEYLFFFGNKRVEFCFFATVCKHLFTVIDPLLYSPRIIWPIRLIDLTNRFAIKSATRVSGHFSLSFVARCYLLREICRSICQMRRALDVIPPRLAETERNKQKNRYGPTNTPSSAHYGGFTCPLFFFSFRSALPHHREWGLYGDVENNKGHQSRVAARLLAKSNFILKLDSITHLSDLC